MDELMILIEAGSLLARMGFADEEIEAVKRYSRETPAVGMTPAQTMLQAAQFLQQKPQAKAALLEACAKPIAVRVAESDLLQAVIPHLRAAAPRWPEADVEEELKSRITDEIERLYPNVPLMQRAEAFLASWSVDPRTGWAFDARKAVPVLLREPEPAPVSETTA